MSNRNKNKTRQQQDQFTEGCRYLGLKLLAEEYQQMVDKANENAVGYYEFISNIVQAEAAAKLCYAGLLTCRATSRCLNI